MNEMKDGPSDDEVLEALEVFERDVNLGLSSTRIMGRILAKKIRQAHYALEAVIADPESYKLSLRVQNQVGDAMLAARSTGKE